MVLPLAYFYVLFAVPLYDFKEIKFDKKYKVNRNCMDKNGWNNGEFTKYLHYEVLKNLEINKNFKRPNRLNFII